MLYICEEEISIFVQMHVYFILRISISMITSEMDVLVIFNVTILLVGCIVIVLFL